MSKIIKNILLACLAIIVIFVTGFVIAKISMYILFAYGFTFAMWFYAGMIITALIGAVFCIYKILDKKGE